VTIGWNQAEAADLPPLTARQRFRLFVRGPWAALSLGLLFAVFLLVRCCEIAVGRLRGRDDRRVGARIVRFWARLALPTLGLRYVQRGTPIRGAGAFVANHSSWIDIVALQRAAAPFLVSKSEVRDWPGIGFIGRAIGTLFIDRKAAAAKQQEAELLDRLSRGDHMAVFPEGTSTDGQRVLPFKSSLFGVFFSPELEGLAFIQPVAIVYQPASGQPASLYAWWGEMDFAAHLLAMLGRSVDGVVELSFLEPVRADQTTGRKEMALICGQRVRAAFDARRLVNRNPHDPTGRPAGNERAGTM
jgi:lyso-ornithine lipid O-acyltransferase